jgi:hypothetical protein
MLALVDENAILLPFNICLNGNGCSVFAKNALHFKWLCILSDLGEANIFVQVLLKQMPSSM